MGSTKAALKPPGRSGSTFPIFIFDAKSPTRLSGPDLPRQSTAVLSGGSVCYRSKTGRLVGGSGESRTWPVGGSRRKRRWGQLGVSRHLWLRGPLERGSRDASLDPPSAPTGFAVVKRSDVYKLLVWVSAGACPGRPAPVPGSLDVLVEGSRKSSISSVERGIVAVGVERVAIEHDVAGVRVGVSTYRTGGSRGG